MRAILAATLTDFGAAYPSLSKLASDRPLVDIAAEIEGLDGRGLRKRASAAMLTRSETTLDPNKLTLDDLRVAAGRATAGNGDVRGVG